MVFGHGFTTQHFPTIFWCWVKPDAERPALYKVWAKIKFLVNVCYEFIRFLKIDLTKEREDQI